MKWLSRKLLITSATILVNGAAARFGIPENVVHWLNQVVMTYLGAQGAVDAVTAWKAPTVPGAK